MLTSNALERIPYALDISKNLGILFPERAQANRWPHKPNDAFDGL